MFKKLLAWLEVQDNRTLIYNAVVALIPVCVAVGFLTSNQAQEVLTVVALLLGLGAAGLAGHHNRKAKHL